MALWQWSKTATNNANSDPTISIPEGMPPSAVNDSERAIMARLAEWRDDLSGMLLDSGTASAYVVTSNEGLQTPTPTDGTRISFIPANTNAANATLAVDGGTAFPIQVPSGTAIGAGVMVALTPYDLVFKTSVSAWLLKGIFAGSPFLVPLGAMLDFTGSTAPNANFAIPIGQAISRTTFASLFTMYNAIGLPYGLGDGSTTFNLPDCRARVIVGQDPSNSTGRMAGAQSGNISGGAANLGSFGGEESHAQTVAELAVHNHSASSSDSGHVHGYNQAVSQGVTGVTGGPVNGSTFSTANTQTGFANISTSISNAGSGAAHNTVQPSIVLNKILRIL